MKNLILTNIFWYGKPKQAIEWALKSVEQFDYKIESRLESSRKIKISAVDWLEKGRPIKLT